MLARTPAAMLLVAALCSAGRADEGMWTFNHFPYDKVEKTYGFRPDQAWLDHVRLSTLLIPREDSASFVSPNGLVLTCYHCAQSCISKLSTEKRNIAASGFYAKQARDELRCPD